jgi:signal transduction histidine kinase/DNA-binding response OmpR family regulator
MESAGADHSFLALYSPDGEIRIDAESRLSKPSRLRTPPLEPDPERHPIEILTTARSVSGPTIVPDARKDKRFSNTQYVTRTGLRSAMCLKIERNDQELGLLFLGHTQASDAFAPRRAQFLSLLTAQFAISLENARGFARLESLVQRRTAALEKAKDRAVAADEAKSQFLAIVSHEIRTPLNAVIGMTALLLDSGLSKDQRDLARTVRDSGDALLALINDLLDFSKIESGRLEFESIPVHLENCLAEAFALVNTQAEAKGLPIHRFIAENVPPVVIGDVTRIRQILVNLLANAVKFTMEGAIQVRVTNEAPPGAEVLLRFEVQDSGIGVPADRQERLFVPFTQVDASTTRNFGGTGLGLAICRRLAETMGGEIGCESEVGRGSTFWFTIPTEASVATAPEGGYAEFGRTKTGTFVFDSELAQRVPLRILVAEDNPVNQKLASYLLERLGYRPEVVGNGREAVIAVNRQPYDVILMDLQMPEMDGLEASRQILRSIPLEERPVIIAVTANTMPGDRERCIRAGMNHYVGKPIRAEELKLALLFASHQLVRRRDLVIEPPPDGVLEVLRVSASGESAPTRSLHGSTPDTEKDSNSDNDLSEFDPACIDQLRELGQASEQDVVSDLVQSYTSQVGLRLVEIQLASRTRDHKKLEAGAHALKGASASLGGVAVADICQRLESDAGAKRVTPPAVVAELEGALTKHLDWLEAERRR